ncbi:MAG: PDZ domain-containing protein, partial [Pseudomonadota bacterium]
MPIVILFTSVLILLAGSALADSSQLERRPSLGIVMDSSDRTIQIIEVLRGGSASNAGILVGDRLQSVNGKTLESVSEVVELAANLPPREPIEYRVLRDGQELSLSGPAIGRPFEVPQAGSIRYDQVNYTDGRLRSLINTPAGRGPFPTVFLIQGYPCQSVESGDPDDYYRRLVRPFIAAGFAVVRVEKPGVGDSDGPLDCVEI